MKPQICNGIFHILNGWHVFFQFVFLKENPLTVYFLLLYKMTLLVLLQHQPTNLEDQGSYISYTLSPFWRVVNSIKIALGNASVSMSPILIVL